MSKLMYFTFHISHFTIISQFPFISAAQWPMARGKLLVNGKRSMVNASAGDRG